MRKLRILTTLACAFVLSFVCLGGCAGQNDEQMIRAALSQELDAAVNLDPGMIAAVEEGMNSGMDFSAYGVSGEDLAKSYLDGFGYTIDNVAVDGDTAKATVTINCKSISDFNDKLDAASDQLIQDIQNGNAPDDINAAIGTMALDSLNAAEVTSTDPIVITYTKNGNEWEPTTSSSALIGQALASN